MTEKTAEKEAYPSLWGKPLSTINVGLELFSETLEQQGVPVAQVDWSPPAGGKTEIMGLLDSLLD